MNKTITTINGINDLMIKRTYPLLSILFADKVLNIQRKMVKRGPYNNERKKILIFSTGSYTQ